MGGSDRGHFECWKIGGGGREGESEGFVFRVGEKGVGGEEGGGWVMITALMTVVSTKEQDDTHITSSHMQRRYLITYKTKLNV